MHCGACEILIEQKLLEQTGVRSVDASISNGTIRIEHEGRVPQIKQLSKWFKGDGYVFSESKITVSKDPLVYFEEGKGVQIDTKLLKKKFGTLCKIAIVFVILYLIERSGAAQYVSVSDSSSLGVFLIFGIVAGLSSCAALVGGMLLSLTKGWNESLGYTATTKQKLEPHISFHIGRLIAYMMFGAVLGAFGSVITFENTAVYAFITIAVSIVMLVIGLQMAGVRFADRFQIRMPKFVTRKVAGDVASTSSRMPLFIGAGTVLLPCGFTLIAQGVALTSGSAIRGAFILLAFALGTMIPLLGIGYASVKGSSNAKRSRSFSLYAGVILVIFALYNVNGQFNVLGWPSVSDMIASGETTKDDRVVQKGSAGEQIVTMKASGFSYAFTGPSTIQAGVPTVLIVDDQGIQGCGVFLSARGLINGFVDLKYGENRIDLGTPKPGTYKITCSMGMVRPIVLTVE